LKELWALEDKAVEINKHKKQVDFLLLNTCVKTHASQVFAGLRIVSRVLEQLVPHFH
jgi:hypothetical protein